ncbi:MAG: gliding motility protein GldL [Bacteroidia bacterium]|nr:gliding motility protein GldL [Bacteroidia bacterium]
MGFNFGELVQTRGWKNFMSKVYGIGAAVVLVGAMFKIMHWPGSGIMLVIGLSVEAFIFFTSAFEPLHQEWDWSLAYPELAGMHDEIEDHDVKKKEIDTKKTALEKFDALINNAEITPELFEKLGNGLRSLNETTEKLSDVSEASVATNNYVASFEKASNKVNEFADLYGKSAQELNNSASGLAKSYEKSAEIVAGSVGTFADTMSQSGTKVAVMVTESGQKLSESYGRLAEAMNAEFENTKTGSKGYAEQLHLMSKNLTALNSVYELQLQGTNEHLESAKTLFSGMEEIMVNMKESAGDVKKYREEISKLGQNLTAMNTIYGNMLSAMNFSK